MPRRRATSPFNLAGERHDTPERGYRIAGERRLPGLQERRPLGGAAGVRVLHDHARRTAELARDPGRSGRVEDVVVGQGLALERRRAQREWARFAVGSRSSIARRRLVRVLAVAQGLDLLEADGQRRRVRILRAWQPRPVRQRDPGGGHAARELRADPGVVGGRVGEGLDRQGGAGARGNGRRSSSLVEHSAVAGRRRDDRHAGVVLGGRADHRRAADVDLLDEVVEPDARPIRRGGERVEVHDDDLERRDLRFDECLAMGRQASIRKDSRHGFSDGAS